MRTILVMAIISALVSCRVENDKRVKFYKDGLLIRREFYPDSTIAYELSYKNDSILQGWSKSYYPSGKLKLAIEYFNGKKQGSETAYYENGNVKYSGYFKEGKEDSTLTWYYEDGKKRAINNWFHGILFGSQTKFDSVGRLVKYSFNNIEGKILYSRTYNVNDGSYREHGKLFDILYDFSNVKVNERIELLIFLVNPANSKVSLIIEEVGDSQRRKLIRLEENDIDKIHYAKRYIYNTSFQKPGTFEIKISMNIIDTLNSKTNSDNGKLTFNVK